MDRKEILGITAVLFSLYCIIHSHNQLDYDSVQIAPRECAIYELFLFEYLGIYDNSSDRFYYSECPWRSLCS